MNTQKHFAFLEGSPLPSAQGILSWQGTSQQYATDQQGNHRIRNDDTIMYLSADSDYRMGVYMTLTLFVEENMISGIDWFATWASHGRPENVKPQVREAQRVVRLIRPLFMSPKRPNKTF